MRAQLAIILIVYLVVQVYCHTIPDFAPTRRPYRLGRLLLLTDNNNSSLPADVLWAVGFACHAFIDSVTNKPQRTSAGRLEQQLTTVIFCTMPISEVESHISDRCSNYSANS